jgi:hypothetical protein
VISLKKLVILLTLAVFAFSAAVAVAAEDFYVIKDKNDVCKVIKAKDKTPKTIAGPFKTKDLAEKAKVEKCPKAAPKEPAKK